MEKPVIGIVMGVSGCGKSTLGLALAAHWSAPFYEGDHYHPPSNVSRMRSGEALDDSHRLPWLNRLRDLVQTHLDNHSPAIISCSALKRRYRELLGRESNLWYIWLDLPEQLLRARLSARSEHFMPASLLASQISALEPPSPDEQFLRLDAAQPLHAMIAHIDQHFQTLQGRA